MGLSAPTVGPVTAGYTLIQPPKPVRSGGERLVPDTGRAVNGGLIAGFRLGIEQIIVSPV